jgi:hypothetical protein
MIVDCRHVVEDVDECWRLLKSATGRWRIGIAKVTYKVGRVVLTIERLAAVKTFMLQRLVDHGWWLVVLNVDAMQTCCLRPWRLPGEWMDRETYKNREDALVILLLNHQPVFCHEKEA